MDQWGPDSPLGVLLAPSKQGSPTLPQLRLFHPYPPLFQDAGVHPGPQVVGRPCGARGTPRGEATPQAGVGRRETTPRRGAATTTDAAPLQGTAQEGHAPQEGAAREGPLHTYTGLLSFSPIGLPHVVMSRPLSSRATHFGFVQCVLSSCTLSCHPWCCAAISSWASSFSLCLHLHV